MVHFICNFLQIQFTVTLSKTFYPHFKVLLVLSSVFRTKLLLYSSSVTESKLRLSIS